VEVFDPASIQGRGTNFRVRVRVTLRLVVYRQSVRLGAEPLETHGQNFSQLNSCGHSPYITSSLMKRWVCHLQLLLALASAYILGSESCGTCDHILLSQIWDFLFCRLLWLAGFRWRYSTRLHMGKELTSKCVSVITSRLRPRENIALLLLLNCFHGMCFVCEGVIQ
jgi:hypothetical protein